MGGVTRSQGLSGSSQCKREPRGTFCASEQCPSPPRPVRQARGKGSGKGREHPTKKKVPLGSRTYTLRGRRPWGAALV